MSTAFRHNKAGGVLQKGGHQASQASASKKEGLDCKFPPPPSLRPRVRHRQYSPLLPKYTLSSAISDYNRYIYCTAPMKSKYIMKGFIQPTLLGGMEMVKQKALPYPNGGKPEGGALGQSSWLSKCKHSTFQLDEGISEQTE